MVDTFVPQLEDVVSCGYYTLPHLPVGNYFTMPDGQGLELTADFVLTQSQTVYVYIPGCSLTGTEFYVEILPIPDVIVEDVVSCGPYTLPPLSVGTYYNAPYGPNGWGQQLQTGDVISYSMNVFVYVEGATPSCNDSYPFWVEIPEFIVYNLIEPCGESSGTAVFTLSDGVMATSPLDEITFYLTEAEALSGSATPLPEVFQNTVPFEQTIYAKLSRPGTECTLVKPYTLYVNTAQYNEPLPILACSDFTDTGYTITSFDPAEMQITYGTQSIIYFYASLSDATTFNAPLQAPYIGDQEVLYANIITGSCTVQIEVPVTVESCGSEENVISGTVTFDSLANGCNSGGSDNYHARNIDVSYTDANGFVTYTSTNQNGNFIFYDVPDGSGTVSLADIAPTFEAAVSPVAVNFSAGDNLIPVNFWITAPASISDIGISFIPTNVPVPGFFSFYRLKIWNSGTQMATGTAQVVFNSSRLTWFNTFIGSVTGNTYSLAYMLEPFASTYVDLVFEVAQPPVVQSGTLLAFTASAILNGDSNPQDNTVVLNQFALNSFDPNDITVHEGAVIAQEDIDKYLHYTVRFENTGTIYATNIRVAVTLDDHLDWSTLEVVESSHTNYLVRQGNMVNFKFDNIFLPDSNVNQFASHGYITYRIKPKANTGIGDSMSATADIFFDFNPAVVTNTVTTTVGAPMGIEQAAKARFTLYPNPASERVFIQLSELNSGHVVITDISGKVVLKQEVSGMVSAFNISSLSSGLYFVGVTADNGSKHVEKLLIK